MSYTGKILKIDLTNKTSSVIDTGPYEQWGGGFGLAQAVFWDECEDVTVGGFDPKNVLVLATNPMTGTIAPSVGNKIEMVGIQVYSYPKEYYTRTNCGQFIGPMLKKAGWDGIVIKGEASQPVWVNIINDKVVFEDAASLWGKDTHYTQEEIWRRVTGRKGHGEWANVAAGGFSTQGPMTLCIGPAGEKLSRLATIQHGPHGGFSQGGFGAIWGKKNLKAISVLGTGSIRVARPMELIKARNLSVSLGGLAAVNQGTNTSRAIGCQSCAWPCKTRRQDGLRNDSMCVGTWWITDTGLPHDPHVPAPPGMMSGPDYCNLYGINVFEMYGSGTDYIKALYDMGVIGPGTDISTEPVPMDKFESAQWAEALVRAISTRDGIGNILAEGTARFAASLGRFEEDVATGVLNKANSNLCYEWHWTTPDHSWTYSLALESRDDNDHVFMFNEAVAEGAGLSAEKYVDILAKKFKPFDGDPFAFDNSHTYDTGIYSEHQAKQTAWLRYYRRFFKDSMGFCDWRWPQFLALNAPDYEGPSPEIEATMINAVTGNNNSFEDYMQVGRKIWNFNRCIVALQGKHRSNDVLSPYMYTPAGSEKNSSIFSSLPNAVPVYKKGKWAFETMPDAYLDKDGFDTAMTHYYELEGWDTENAWPTRETLEELDLGNLADTLDSAGKLGNSK